MDCAGCREFSPMTNSQVKQVEDEMDTVIKAVFVLMVWAW